MTQRPIRMATSSTAPPTATRVPTKVVLAGAVEQHIGAEPAAVPAAEGGGGHEGDGRPPGVVERPGRSDERQPGGRRLVLEVGGVLVQPGRLLGGGAQRDPSIEPLGQGGVVGGRAARRGG